MLFIRPGDLPLRLSVPFAVGAMILTLKFLGHPIFQGRQQYNQITTKNMYIVTGGKVMGII